MENEIFVCMSCGQRFSKNAQNSHSEIVSCPSCQQKTTYSDSTNIVTCPICNAELALPVKYRNMEELICYNCNSNIKIADVLNVSGGEDEHPPMLKPDDIFDKYRIIRLLGRGGMAEVYLVEHTVLKQQLALKLLFQNNLLNSDVGIKRFIREAKLTHKIKHPNIVEACDAGVDSKTGIPFIVMEYIEGKNLSEISSAGPLPEEELKAIFESIFQALKKLHREKIVHRDIKPSNIMLTSDGVYKLMDLGIARVESDHSVGEVTLTVDNSAVGTFNYASPEQCKSAHDVDFRSDLYSLGATLYSLATGKVPHDGTSTLEVILSVLNDTPEELRHLRPDLSDQFVSMLKWMMEKSPAARPGSMEALEAFYKGRGFGSSSVGKLMREGSSFLQNNKKLRIAVGVFLVLLIAVSSYFVIQTLSEFREEFSSFESREVVRSNDLSKLSLLGSYDFRKDCNLEKNNVSVQTWTYAGAITEYEQAMGVGVPEMNPYGFTVSVDYKYDPDHNRDLECKRSGYMIYKYKDRDVSDFSFGLYEPLRLCIFDNYINLCFNDSVIRTGKYVKSGEWANYTLSYDYENDLLTFYLNNKYVGSYKVSEKMSDPKNDFRFLGGEVMPRVKKSFRNFKLYAGVLTAPENHTPLTLHPQYVLSPYTYDNFSEALAQAQIKDRDLVVTISRGEGSVSDWRSKVYGLRRNAVGSAKYKVQEVFDVKYDDHQVVTHEIVIVPGKEIDKAVSELLQEWQITMDALPIAVVLDSNGKVKHYLMNGERTPSPIPLKADARLKILLQKQQTLDINEQYKIARAAGIEFSSDRKTVIGVNRKNILEAIIPRGVTKIDSKAFQGCRELQFILLPETLTVISDYAFAECGNLKNIVIPNRVTKIGGFAFQHCGKLKNITIPDSVTEIGNRAFEYCELERIDIGKGLKSFKDSEGMTAKEINVSVENCNFYTDDAGALFERETKTLIRFNRSFAGDYVIPDGVEHISERAFSHCKNLRNVTIPDSVSSIGDNAFAFCRNLQSVAIPRRVTVICEGTFYQCDKLQCVVLPAGLTSIRSGAFASCSNLQSINIPGKLKFIGRFAFENCRSLRSIYIPDSVREIGRQAFYMCTNLQNVTLGHGLRLIESEAFGGCVRMKPVKLPPNCKLEKDVFRTKYSTVDKNHLYLYWLEFMD